MGAIHFVRRGQGRPLLLVHGLGGSWRSWTPILDQLARERDVIAIDLPGFGQSPPLNGRPTLGRLCGSLHEFLIERNLHRVDAVGHSMGAGLLLRMADRDSQLGTIVALAPGGFRGIVGRAAFFITASLGRRFLRRIQPLLRRWLTRPVVKRLLLFPLSARPDAVPISYAWDELCSIVEARSYHALLIDVTWNITAYRPVAEGRQIVLAWGSRDMISGERSAARARAAFPQARFHSVPDAGHYLQWDAPDELVRLILASTSPS